MPIKKILVLLASFVFALCLIFIIKPSVSRADDLDDINKQLSSLTDELNKSVAATKPVESQLTSMQAQIASIKNRIPAIEQDIQAKKKAIDEGYKKLADKDKIITATIRDFYMKSYYDSPLLIFFTIDNANDATQALAYQHAKTKQDKAIITNIALSIIDLEKKKAELIDEQKSLVVAKASLDEQSAKLDKIVSGAKSFQSQLSGKIAQLSEKQQSLVAAKLGSIYVPRSADTSAAGCSSDIGKNPGFSPQIGFFSFGANTHYNGMNQYGARGRAKDGQNEEQILHFYYPNMSLRKDYSQGETIKTTSGWSGTIEDYVKRIYEMPDSWTENNSAALKAQAVAARSYALNSMKRNGSICTTESCQVFKDQPKGGNWEAAVNATAGWVLMDGGDPGFTEFASTHGGYVNGVGFDGSGGNPGNFGDLKSRAYDRESPWFYCDWGSRSEYNGTAWLKTSEVADIANAILLARADSSAAPNLYQSDKGGWDAEKVKSELQKHRSAFNNVGSVSVGADFGSGVTNSVTVSGDAGSETFNGNEWKDWFNSRAPANIQIKSRLYNVEQ